MKLQKRIVVLLLIAFIISLTNVVFATDNQTNSKVQPRVAEENMRDEAEEKDKTLDDEIMLITDEPKLYTKTIPSEVREFSSDNIEYDKYYIDGNVFILGSKKVKIKNSEISGNVIITADKVELDNTTVNGTVLICANKISLDAIADSAYIMGDEIDIEKDAMIKKEFRILGQDVVFSGMGGREVAIFGKNVEITDDAKIYGDCYIEAEEISVSEDSVLGEIHENNIQYLHENPTVTIKNKLFESFANIIIVLIIAIFVLGGFPKFTQVNNNLRLRDFVKSFFTGLIELVFCFVIAIVILVIGYGIGYAFALITLSIVFACLGKALFIIASAIRLGGNTQKVSKVKAFFMTFFVAIIIEAIGYIALLGNVGAIIVTIFDFVIGISGFGAMMKVIFTPNKSNKKVENNVVVKANTVDTIDSNKNYQKESNQEELQAEVRKEIQEEIKELQEEREIEKKLEENVSNEENVPNNEPNDIDNEKEKNDEE